MAYLFIPPVVDEGPMGGDWLFARYTRKQGVSVFRIDGQLVRRTDFLLKMTWMHSMFST